MEFLNSVFVKPFADMAGAPCTRIPPVPSGLVAGPLGFTRSVQFCTSAPPVFHVAGETSSRMSCWLRAFTLAARSAGVCVRI